MKTYGFELLTERAMQEVHGTARLWRHAVTGAQLLSISNDDENKCFDVSFRTPPADSTGVAHILEHSVLCGSDKYPVKEPFVELLKGSLQTFLNAFTFPDKTCYPVASANLQDFYNLMDVYMDAVFHPRISEDIFRQEGWHIEAESPDEPWSYKGVVYNEMKGAYSSPDSVLAEQSQQAVFPDTLYSLDSGGNPEVIPDLTYEAFRDFHARYYHPSNARFFFWGDDPEEERLRRVAEVLEGYAARPVDSAVPLQPRRETPRQIEVPYAAAEGEKRALFTVNWLLGERGDVYQALLMEMLEHILEGLPGSPLRRALIASGLGEDTTGCGLETDLRQMYYSTGLKGVDPRKVPEAELLIFETLACLVEEGIPASAVEAAVNSVEFAYRENNSGRFPRGLAAMIQALSTWLYDGDPLAALAWEAPLATIKERLAAGEKLFEDAIRTHFLDNAHRATVVLLPDHGLEKARLDAEAARLRKAQEACDAQARQRLVSETARLQAAQEAPDSPEALATIPNLHVADMPPRNTPLPIAGRSLSSGNTLLCHELSTQGIAYVGLLLPLDTVPHALQPLLPLFARCLTEAGTARRDFTELGAHMAAKTGGVGADMVLTTHREGRGAVRYLGVMGKAVQDKIPDLFDIFREILLEPLRESDVLLERMGQMLLEDKARLEHGLVAAGHAAVGLRLRAHFTELGRLAERTSGLSYLQEVRRLLERLERDPQSLLADLETLRKHVVARPGALLDVTGESTALHRVEEEGARLLRSLPDVRTGEPVAVQPLDLPDAEAFFAPAQVNYVGKAANLIDLGYPYRGAMSVVLRSLRMGYLWERVRVRGGAYGAMCTLDRLGGNLVLASYRDPNVEETLRAYDELPAFLRANAPDADQLERAIVGAIGDLDAYLLPDARGAQALSRYLSGDTEELRQRMREEILATTARDFLEMADVLEEVAKAGVICVLGGATTRAAAQAHGWSGQEIMA